MTKLKPKHQNSKPLVRPTKYLSKNREWIVLNYQTFNTLLKVSELEELFKRTKKNN